MQKTAFSLESITKGRYFKIFLIMSRFMPFHTDISLCAEEVCSHKKLQLKNISWKRITYQNTNFER